MHFKSHLVYLHGEGTYTDSKISVGMAFTDSNRSENTIVRTSFTPWIIASDILTSTFAGVGARSFDQPRYILNMRNADEFLDHIVNGLRSHLGGRKIIAEPNTEDLNTISNFYSVNQISPSHQNLKNLGIAVARTPDSQQ